ncbi:hemolysin family protein [Clostridium sp. MSJ-4]|uniref:Hemolysin family protein n=1 Tax=Clostridium simiarum TaxID=2841506 RepID=A0ABS6F6C3_9CLOT|nr:hemolysin family protein [Clostridium simiarum]MBU5593375.1 hemolysin family protein [Clostridium simiarum]
MDPSTWQLVLLVVLLLMSAFFSASETALMSFSKIRIKHLVEEGVKGADKIEKLIGSPNKLLGSILVGNNIANIAASALATSIALDVFGARGVGIATIIMTVLVLIFGEITPKSLAAQNSEKVSFKVYKPIGMVVTIFKPVVAVFTFLSSGFIKLLGGNPEKTQPFITQEELKTLVDVGEEEGVLEVEEKEMIYNVFEFGDLQVKDVMIQRVDIVAITTESTYEEILEVIKREQFSRIPVYNETIDNIVGILYVKDLLLREKEEEFKVEEYMREANYTYEFRRITDLFSDMKKDRNHMYIVLDEYGGTVGIVTIEDLVEEIVGDIEDEYDDEDDREIDVIKEDEYIVSGSAKLDDINDLIGTSIESEEFDSVGGFIIGQLGRFPDMGDNVQYENIKFVIEDIDKNRIKKVRIFT